VTNIEYDSARFFVDNKEVEKFYTPKKWTHILEIVLFKNKEKVGEKNLVFEVK
jgi:hypothetical protein